MHKIIKFAIREYKSAVKTKGFIIGLVLAPILMSGGPRQNLAVYDSCIA